MAAFDFPSSPSVNQTYTANGVTWKWNGTMWMRVSGAGYLEKIEEGNSKVEVDDSGSGNVTVTTDGTERLRITSDGKTGVGVASPLNLFHVKGANTIARFQSSTSYVDVMFQNTGATNGFIQYNNSGNFNFYANSGSTPTLTIEGGAPGNVGINQTNPERKLHINSGTTDTALKLESTDAEVSIELTDNAGSSYIGGGGNYLNFYSGGNERIRVDSSGCLRVGNTHAQTTSGNTKRIALGAKANIWGWTSGNVNGALTLADNYYWDGSNNRAIEADEAAYLSLRSGTLRYGTTDSTPSAGGVTGLTEKFRVDTSGNLLLGQGHTTVSDLAGGFTKRLAIEGTSAANSSIGLTRNANDDNPPYIYFGKSRGTSAGSNTVIGNGDTIGMVNFAGSRGSSSFGDAVNLRAIADANFSGSSSPGRFSVWTTPANSTSPLESFQVNSAGAITAPRNVSWSYSRSNNGASWGSASGLTYGGRQYRSPLPLFGASGTNYDTHNSLSTFTSGGGTGIKFTAPVGGKYLVMFNMSSVKNNTNADWGSIGLMRNDTSQASTGSLDYMLDTMYFPDTTSTGNQLGWGGSVIVNLSQNDYIVPYTMSVENFSSDNQFYFQGYLLG